MALRKKSSYYKYKHRTYKKKNYRFKPKFYKRAAVKKYIKKRVKGRMLQNVSQQCYLVIDPSGKYDFVRNTVPEVINQNGNVPVYDPVMLGAIGNKVRDKGFYLNGLNFDELLAGDSTFASYSRIFRKFRIKFIKTQVTPLFCPGTDLIALCHLKDAVNPNQSNLRTGSLQELTYDNILESRFKRAAKTNTTTFYNINPYHATQEVQLNSVPVTNTFLRASSFTLPCVCSCVITFQMVFSEQNVGRLNFSDFSSNRFEEETPIRPSLNPLPPHNYAPIGNVDNTGMEIVSENPPSQNPIPLASNSAFNNGVSPDVEQYTQPDPVSPVPSSSASQLNQSFNFGFDNFNTQAQDGVNYNDSLPWQEVRPGFDLNVWLVKNKIHPQFLRDVIDPLLPELVEYSKNRPNGLSEKRFNTIVGGYFLKHPEAVDIYKYVLSDDITEDVGDSASVVSGFKDVANDIISGIIQNSYRSTKNTESRKDRGRERSRSNDRLTRTQQFLKAERDEKDKEREGLRGKGNFKFVSKP